jgi:hypothetical protein
MESVVTPRADPQVQIDLRRRAQPHARTVCAGARKSSILRSHTKRRTVCSDSCTLDLLFRPTNQK